MVIGHARAAAGKILPSHLSYRRARNGRLLSAEHAPLQNGDCYQFPPLELDSCPRFALLRPNGQFFDVLQVRHGTCEGLVYRVEFARVAKGPVQKSSASISPAFIYLQFPISDSIPLARYRGVA